MVEACKFAFAQRTLLGDWRGPGGAAVRETVEELASPAWWEAVAANLTGQTMLDPRQYGAQYNVVEDAGTSHISVLSPAGDAVAVTSTINLLYGSKEKTNYHDSCIARIIDQGMMFGPPSVPLSLNWDNS